MAKRCIVSAIAVAVVLGSCSKVSALTYFYSFDKHFDWDDVAGPEGMGGHAFWKVTETGGNPGGALRIYTNYDHKDFRAIQINVEPGSVVRIQFDVRIPLQDPAPNTFIRARYFDGYVSALSFVSADDLGSPYPAPFFEHNSGTDDVWRHVDHRTPVLENSVFTMIFHIEGFLPSRDGRNECLIDNLQLDFSEQSELRDPFLEWGGMPGSKYITWRLNSNGRHIAWCDFMEERNHWFDGFCQLVPATINYDSVYDTTQFPLQNHAKADFEHNAVDVGKSGVLRVNVSHDESHGKIYGIRQTVSYDAILPPGSAGECEVQADAATYDGLNQQIARFWLGIDPHGGRDVKEERYPECTGCCNGAPILWDNSFGVGHFRNLNSNPNFERLVVSWERPAGADAFTIFLKCLDWRQNTDGASIGADFLVNAVLASGVATAVSFRRGDSNADDDINIADAVFTLSYIFVSGPSPACLDTADANDDGAVDLADGVYILQNIFANGPAIPLPHPECGVDSTEDDVGCVEYAHCE